MKLFPSGFDFISLDLQREDLFAKLAQWCGFSCRCWRSRWTRASSGRAASSPACASTAGRVLVPGAPARRRRAVPALRPALALLPGVHRGGDPAAGHGRDLPGALDRANLTGLVLGCIEAKFCKKICVGKLSPRSTQCTPWHRFGIESQKTRKPWGEKNLVPFSNLNFFVKNF